MKFIYPAVFKKTEDGRYKGTFPDLEGCFGEGDTLDEAHRKCQRRCFRLDLSRAFRRSPGTPAHYRP